MFHVHPRSTVRNWEKVPRQQTSAWVSQVSAGQPNHIIPAEPGWHNEGWIGASIVCRHRDKEFKQHWNWKSPFNIGEIGLLFFLTGLLFAGTILCFRDYSSAV